MRAVRLVDGRHPEPKRELHVDDVDLFEQARHGRPIGPRHRELHLVHRAERELKAGHAQVIRAGRIRRHDCHLVAATQGIHDVVRCHDSAAELALYRVCHERNVETPRRFGHGTTSRVIEP